MKRIMIIFFLALAVVSCEKRPLMELSNTHYVRVYVDETIKNVTCGFYNDMYARPEYDSPDVLRLVLADPQTGEVKAERFLRNCGNDGKGLYYDGYIVADPGRYTLMAYNFDTESTIIKSYNNHRDAKAYTNEIASHLRTKIASRSKKLDQSGTSSEQASLPERIVYDPDHLFAANCGEVIIPYVEKVDTLFNEVGEHFKASSIVKSYYLQVKVKGMQYATSSVGLMTGLAGSAWMSGAGMDESDPVTVYFEMQPGETPAAGMVKSEDDDSVVTIYTTFSTFGKIPDVTNELEITFDFMTVYGESHSETLDVTEVFSEDVAIDNQWLLLNHTIEIPEPPPSTGGGGGFSPGVEDWGDVNADITI